MSESTSSVESFTEKDRVLQALTLIIERSDIPIPERETDKGTYTIFKHQYNGRFQYEIVFFR